MRIPNPIRAEKLRWLAAELLVVVLGVMIALGVDEWRDARSDRATERLYLARLLTEVQADSARLSQIERGVQSKDLALEAVHRWLSGGDPAPTDTIRLGLSESFGWAIPYQPPAAYAEMSTTGALTLIRDEKLRGEIVSYYRTWEETLARALERRSAYPGLISQAILPDEAFLPVSEAGAQLARVPGQELLRAVTHEMNYSRFLGGSMVPALQARTQSLLAALRAELSRG